MNLLDMTISDSKLKKGDLLRFERRVYSHWAVYAGDGNVIHLGAQPDAGPSAAFDSWSSGSFFGVLSNKASVRKDTLQDVAKNSNVYRSNQFDGMLEVPYTDDEIVRRAESFLGTIGYNVVTFNCEHFANYVRYGVPLSNQVRIDPRFNGHSVYYELAVVLTNSTERHQNSRFSSPHTNNFGITNYERNVMQLRFDEIKHDCLPIGRYSFRAKLGNSVLVNIEVNAIPLSTGDKGYCKLLVKRTNSTETRQNSYFSSPHKNSYSITNCERNEMQFRFGEIKRDCLPIGRYCFRTKLGNSVSMNIEVTITPSDNGSADYHKLFDEMTKDQNYYVSRLWDHLAMPNYEQNPTTFTQTQLRSRNDDIDHELHLGYSNYQHFTQTQLRSRNEEIDHGLQLNLTQTQLFSRNGETDIDVNKALDREKYNISPPMICEPNLQTYNASNIAYLTSSNIHSNVSSDMRLEWPVNSPHASNVSGIKYPQWNPLTSGNIWHNDIRSDLLGMIAADNAEYFRRVLGQPSRDCFSLSVYEVWFFLLIYIAYILYLYYFTE